MLTSAGSCGGLQGDVVFVLDASGSVGSSDFQTMLQFVNDLVDDFDIGTDLVRVGVVKFASSVYPEIDLHDHSDKSALKNTILGIAYTAGGTYTGKCPESLFPSHSLRLSLRPPPPLPPPPPPPPPLPNLPVYVIGYCFRTLEVTLLQIVHFVASPLSHSQRKSVIVYFEVTGNPPVFSSLAMLFSFVR